MKVAHDGAVAGEQELLGVVATEGARIHFALEELNAAVPVGPQHCRQVDAQVGAAVDGLTADETDVVGVVGEEVETRRQHVLDLAESALVVVDGVFESDEPVAEHALEHFAVQTVFRTEVVQQALALDADTGSDVVQ